MRCQSAPDDNIGPLPGRPPPLLKGAGSTRPQASWVCPAHPHGRRDAAARATRDLEAGAPAWNCPAVRSAWATRPDVDDTHRVLDQHPQLQQPPRRIRRPGLYPGASAETGRRLRPAGANIPPRRIPAKIAPPRSIRWPADLYPLPHFTIQIEASGDEGRVLEQRPSRPTCWRRV